MISIEEFEKYPDGSGSLLFMVWLNPVNHQQTATM
jgi:hypothetical protein